jgi:hypothetical protein
MDGTGMQQGSGHGRQRACVRVEDPPFKGPFNSYQIDWVDDVSYINSDRLSDFVEGEGSRHGEAPTRFVKRCSYNRPGRRRTWLSYGRYFCQYGTENRGKKSMSSSQFIQDPASKPKIGAGSRDRLDHDSVHKGCQCKFSAIEVIPNARIPPNTMKLIYRHRSHVDKDGVPCHGSANPASRHLPSQMAHTLSPKTR